MCGRQGDLRSYQPAQRIGGHINDGSDRIARRRGAQVGRHYVRTLAYPPDKQGLTKIAALLRDAIAAGHIEQPAEADGRIDDESGGRARRRVEPRLQQIVHQDAWLLQIRIQIMQSFVDRAGYGRSYAFGHWSEYFLIRRQYLAVCILVGIADRQRGVAGCARACAHEECCCPRDHPLAP